MIDLNYSPKKKKDKEEDLPMGLLLISFSPFALLFWYILTQAFLHGIF